MRFSKYTFIISALVVLSLAGLIYIQYYILKKDIETNESQMSFAIPSILLDVYDELSHSDELNKLMAVQEGTEEFKFINDDQPKNEIQILVKSKLDKVLKLNYPKLNYKVDGFISNEYGCLIHSHHGEDLPNASKVLSAENHICFCTITCNTLDIAMTYSNKRATVLSDSSLILFLSFILIMIITIAFAFTLYTIIKQKKLSDLKKDFINNLTHEFKTPIFSISLAAKSLLKSKEISASDKLTNYTELIGSESNRLKNQVDKIMQMALIDSGNLTLDKKQVDLHELIRLVTDNLKMMIEDKEGSVLLKLRATKYLVLADETHLKNIVYNLIDNALKYSLKTPEIEIHTNDHQEGVLFSIKDNGIGMDKEQQKYIFDQFYRAQKGDVHEVKGFGLGLSYVKSIVEAHKGKLSLNSIINHGSEFSIYLPI